MPKDEFDPEDPMELCGVGLVTDEDTSEAMTDCFIEEFMRLGYNHKQLLALFRNPHYIGVNMVLQNKGEQFVRNRIAEAFAAWGKPVAWKAPCVEELKSDELKEKNASTLQLFNPSTPMTDPMGNQVPLEVLNALQPGEKAKSSCSSSDGSCTCGQLNSKYS